MLPSKRPSSGDEEDAGKPLQDAVFNITRGDRTNANLGNAIAAEEENTALDSLRVSLEERQSPVAPSQDAAFNVPHQFPPYRGDPFIAFPEQQPTTNPQAQGTSANLESLDWDIGAPESAHPQIPGPYTQNPPQYLDPQLLSCPLPPQPHAERQIQNLAHGFDPRRPVPYPRHQDLAPSGTVSGQPSFFHQQPNVRPIVGPSYPSPISPNNSGSPREAVFPHPGDQNLGGRGNNSAGVRAQQSNFGPGPQPRQPTDTRQPYSPLPPGGSGLRPSLPQIQTTNFGNLGKRKHEESPVGSTPSSRRGQREQSGRALGIMQNQPSSTGDQDFGQDTPLTQQGNLTPRSVTRRHGYQYGMPADITLPNTPNLIPTARPAPIQRLFPSQNIPSGQHHSGRHENWVNSPGNTFQFDQAGNPLGGFVPPENRTPSYGSGFNPQSPYHLSGDALRDHRRRPGLGSSPGRDRSSASISSPYGYHDAPGPVNYGGGYPRDSVPNPQHPPMRPYSPRIPHTQQPLAPQPHPPPRLPRYPSDVRRPTNVMSDAQRALAARQAAPINPSNVRRPSQRAAAAVAEEELAAAVEEGKRPKPVRQANVKPSKTGKSHCVVSPPGFPTVPPRGETPHETLLDAAQNRPEEFIRLYPNDVWDHYGWIVARRLGSSAKFKKCFQKHHNYDPYIAGKSAWKNSIGKKIAAWGKNYFGPLPGWKYQLPKQERLSDWEKPETWVENGRKKVRWAAKGEKADEKGAEGSGEEDDDEEDGEEEEDDGEEEEDDVDEPDAEAAGASQNSNLDPEMLRPQRTLLAAFPTLPAPIDYPPWYNAGPHANANLYGSVDAQQSQHASSYTTNTQPNPATQASYIPHRYGPAAPQSGPVNPVVEKWIDEFEEYAQDGAGYRDSQGQESQQELPLQCPSQEGLNEQLTEEGRDEEDAEFELDHEYDASLLRSNELLGQIQTRDVS